MLRFLYLLLLFSPSLHADTSIRVLVSVGPLQLIANEVMSGVNRADVLIEAETSPHHFQLKPSHLRKIASTDLLIWISNDFETSLARLSNQLNTGTTLMQLADELPADQLIGHGHDLDGHVWLSPQNASIISELLTEELSKLDEKNSNLYRQNAKELNARLDAWLEMTHDRISTMQPAYITNHQFLRYWERSLGLHSMGSLRNSHDHGGHIRGLAHLNAQLQKAPAKCLLVDRLPASRQARQIAARHDLEIRHIDVLSGADEMPSIIDLYQRITDTLQGCQ